MAMELDEFVHTLSNSGLMTAADVDKFISGLPDERRPKDTQQLVQELVRQKKLTKFQARAVYQKSSTVDGN